MNARDRFFRGIVDDLLGEDERILHTGTAFSRDGFFFPCGRHYYVALTNQNIILIETDMGAWGILCECLGVSVIAIPDLVVAYKTALLNIKKLVLHTKHNGTIMLGINSLARQVSGHREFCRKGIPYLIRTVSGQNALNKRG